MIVAVGLHIQTGATSALYDFQFKTAAVEVRAYRVESVAAAGPLTPNLDAIAVADLVHAVFAVGLPHLALHDLPRDVLEVDSLFQFELPIPHLNEVVQHQARHVIEVPVYLLHGEAALLADFAPWLVLSGCVLVLRARIAEVGFRLGNGCQAVAMLVEASIAVVAIEHFVALEVGAAEADLAVRFELAVVLALSFVCRRPVGLAVLALLVDLVRLEDLLGLVGVTLPEVLKDVRPNQRFVDLLQLLLVREERPVVVHQYLETVESPCVRILHFSELLQPNLDLLVHLLSRIRASESLSIPHHSVAAVGHIHDQRVLQ